MPSLRRLSMAILALSLALSDAYPSPLGRGSWPSGKFGSASCSGHPAAEGGATMSGCRDAMHGEASLFILEAQTSFLLAHWS